MTTWTKEELASSVNQRVDAGLMKSQEYIMPADISDAALEQFQDNWDNLSADQARREKQFKLLYQSIIAGF
jgi:hypothetical protein